jgi:hypothetical protein
MSHKDYFWYTNWDKQYRAELSRDVKDSMILKALDNVLQELKDIKDKLKIGEEE